MENESFTFYVIYLDFILSRFSQTTSLFYQKLPTAELQSPPSIKRSYLRSPFHIIFLFYFWKWLIYSTCKEPVHVHFIHISSVRPSPRAENTFRINTMYDAKESINIRWTTNLMHFKRYKCARISQLSRHFLCRIREKLTPNHNSAYDANWTSWLTD